MPAPAVVALMVLASLPFAAWTAVPALATHDPGIPVAASVPFDGAAWAAWRVEVGSDEGHVDVEARGLAAGARLLSVGSWLLNADGSVRFEAVQNQFADAATQVHAQVLDPEHTLVDFAGGGDEGPFTVATGFLGLPRGTYIALLVAAADVPLRQGALELYADPGTRIVAASQGSDAFLHRDPDFQGLVNTYANAALPPVQAKLIVAGEVREDIEHTLYARFQALTRTQLVRMGYTGPDGAHDGALDYAIQPGGPGSYDFRVDLAVDGGAGPVRSHIWVVGADVALP